MPEPDRSADGASGAPAVQQRDLPVGAGAGPLPYRETLRPRPWSWSLPIGFAGCLGLAVGAAYDAAAGAAVAALTAGVLLLWLLAAWRTRIAVDAEFVRADRAALPARHVGRVKALSKQEAFVARTADADPRAYTLLRTWAAPAAVILEVTDPEDPHPYWLISTRRPDALADAIVAARECARAG
jgi:Protein of unknown function (DUF3093)